MADQERRLLKRFTNMTVAIDMLVNKRITLLRPTSWHDKNDVGYIEAFRKARKAESIFAVCFTQATEAFHHWGVFAGGIDGVKVNFDKKKLISGLIDKPGFHWNDVEYKTIDQLRNLSEIALHDLPFVKSSPYASEDEFRILFESNDPKENYHDIQIENDWVTSLTVSPWMPENLVRSMKDIIPNLPGWKGLRVLKPTILDNRVCKKVASKLITDQALLPGRPRNPIY